MLSKLTPAHYLSQAIFDQERDRIFRKLWLFAAFRTSVAESGAFVTRTMAGLPVLLQNCDGHIRAFENLCPHRQMPLQQEAFGQASMVCPYHGWVFDNDGRVKTIPNEATLYAYTPEERGNLCLRKYSVAVIGNMVFINLAESPIALEAQFTSGFQSALAEVSSYFASQAVHVNIPVRYNWKLNCENVMDGNHIPYIHPKSFQPLLRKGELNASRASKHEPSVQSANAEALSNEASALDFSLQAQSCVSRVPMQVEALPWHQSVDRYGDSDTFHTFSVFPNVNFISPGGLTFIAQQFEPLAPGYTELRMTLTVAREKQRIRGLPALLRTYLKGEAAVVNEDIAYLEALQSHLHHGAASAQHGRYEYRLRAAAEAYLDLLGSEPVL